MESKACSHCGEVKTLDQFSLTYSKQYPNQKRSYCERCRCKMAYQSSKERYRNNEDYRERRRIAGRERERRNRADPSKRAMYLIKDCKKCDKKRGLDCDLNKDVVETLIASPCTYCGDTDSIKTLDRIDNAVGHLLSNVVCSCIRCNMIKRDMPHDAWLEITPVIRRLREEGRFGDWTPDIHKAKR